MDDSWYFEGQTALEMRRVWSAQDPDSSHQGSLYWSDSRSYQADVRAKSAFHSTMVDENSWKAFNRIRHWYWTALLPGYSSIADIASSFSAYCIKKVSSMISSSLRPLRQTIMDRVRLHSFTQTLVEKIRKIVMGHPSKSCYLNS